MIYKVFLDTNIYDASNYSFSNVTFSGLKSYAKKGIVQLQINSVVEGEVQGHIKERVTSAVKGVNKALKEAAFAGFRTMPDFQEKMKKFNESEWVSKAEGEFQKLLVECGITRISVNGINVEKIMNDYFNKRLPFENKKPDEFKDAIAIESIIAEVKKLTADEIYCVISNDKGFANASNL